MALTDTQLETMSRDLLTIARCARQLHAQLGARTRVGDDGVWHRPVYGPRPPCSITVLDLLHDCETILAGWLGNLAEDLLGETIPGAEQTPRQWATTRDRTAHDMANRLWEQRHLLAGREWATTAAEEIHDQADILTRHAEPPPPTPKPTTLNPAAAATTGTAAELSRALTQAGYDVPAGTIRYWGSTGVITKYQDEEGRPIYKLGDIHTHITKEPTNG